MQADESTGSGSSTLQIYSYSKFKELADDRMSLVKIFVRKGEHWEPSGKGTIKYYQLQENTVLKEVKSIRELSTSIDNLYILIDSSEVDDMTEEEKLNMRSFSRIIKMREFRVSSIVAFYDIKFGVEFECDIERKLTRKGDLLDPYARGTASDRPELCLRRDLH